MMLSLPSAAMPLLMSFLVAFTKPTFGRAILLMVGMIIALRQRTVTAALWVLRGMAPGHPSIYHRIFSRAAWSLWPLGRILATALLSQMPPDEPILVPRDDTTAQHRGKCVYGKGCHHDAVRSAHKHVVFRWGHRWVFVRDLQGTHRDEYFYSTDPSLTAQQIVSGFTARWPIETTFQEVRTHLGFETTRQRVARSVLRTAPCLLGLFRVICLIYAQHVKSHRTGIRHTLWYAKEEPTFSDAMATVRRLFWREILLQQPSYRNAFQKLPPKIRTWVLDRLCQAA